MILLVIYLVGIPVAYIVAKQRRMAEFPDMYWSTFDRSMAACCSVFSWVSVLVASLIFRSASNDDRASW